MSATINGRRVSALILPAAVLFFLPALAGASWLLSGGTMPMQSLLVMAGIYLMAVSWLAMNFLNARTALASAAADAQTTALAKVERMRVMQSWPALELMTSVNAQGAPRSIEITAAIGICPRGFKVGDRITVEGDGTLSQPICRAAVSALNPALDSEANLNNGTECQVSCLCPMAMRHLTFSIGREPVATLN